MERERVITEDGSDTFFVPGLNEHYHSVFGAVAESKHVFIDSGFHSARSGKRDLHLLEVGFGTGLNALLTQIEAETTGVSVHYTALEPFPLEEDEWLSLNYPQFFCSLDYTPVFRNLHEAEWNRFEQISPLFSLNKIKTGLEDYQPGKESFDLLYFDAFGPEVQPELWTEELFRKISSYTKTGGILVTYSVRGSVTRALKAAGFEVEKLPGPRGKREITRAVKSVG